MTITKVIAQFEIIRRTGAYNMLDANGVQDMAAEFGYEELADLTQAEYAQMLAKYPRSAHDIAQDQLVEIARQEEPIGESTS